MNTSSKILIVLGAVVIVVLGFVNLSMVNAVKQIVVERQLGSTSDTTSIDGNFTPTSVSVSSTRQMLLDVNAARTSAEICNLNVASSSDINAAVYILLSNASTSVSTSTGRPIYGGQCYSKIGENFNYRGQVWALQNGATASRVSVQEYKGGQ